MGRDGLAAFVSVCLTASLCACGASAPAAAPGHRDGAAGASTTTDAPVDGLGSEAPPTDVYAGPEASREVAGERAAEDAPVANADALGATDGAAPEGGGATDAGAAAWPAVADYGARGPFPVTVETNTGPGSAYDVFRPTALGAGGLRHPIVSWANGTLFSISDYQNLLEHWASYGLVVIAAQTNSTAGGATHKAAIDWLVAEAARAGSVYFGVLDTKHVAAAGHSQGGGATIAAGAGKAGPLALTTTLPLMPILSFESDKTIVSKQTAPMFNVNATMDTRDPTGTFANQIFDGANEELVQAAFIGIHEDAMSAAMFAPTLAWFRLRLMGDVSARAVFYPVGTCALCLDKAWKQVREKNVP
jgi:hypothetical protein